MHFIQLYSPNFDTRPSGVIIDTILIHHTNMKDAQAALERLCNKECVVSAHYLISKQGEVYQMVPDELKAHHAGAGAWRGRDAVNDRSIGIELDNCGAEPFSQLQMESLISLCHRLIKLHRIPLRNIIGHYDMAPNRKDDPNHFFDWEILAKEGVGTFPFSAGHHPLGTRNNLPKSEIIKIQQRLQIYGYKIDLTGEFDFQTNQVIIAFKRHFCSNTFLRSDQEIWNFEAEQKLNQLMDIINEES